MTVKVASLPNRHKESVIEYAKDLLARAERGEVSSVCAVEEYPDGTYNILGSTTMSRLQSAGALMDAAIRRLQS